MKVKISNIKPNPNNPRYIRDEKFEKLKKSIQDFPEMLKLRPLVVDDDMIVLGGNMRLKALTELGIEEAEVIKAKDLTEKQKAEFIIKDNVGFGDWDWDMLANEWDVEELGEWGLSIWQPEQSESYNDNENFKDHDALEGYLNRDTGVLRLSFLQEQYKEVVKKLDAIQKEEFAEDHSETFLKILEKYEDLRNSKK